MRLHLVWIVGVLGCGSVEKAAIPDAAIPDAAIPDAPSDGPLACTIHDTIDSCGAACTQCAAGPDRTMPVCDGTACSVACMGAAPKCSDDSCSRLAWTFGSNAAEGVVLLQPAGFTAAVRNHAGNLALAVTVAQLQGNELWFRVPVCLSGTTQLQTRTLKATIYLEGGTDTSNQYYVQAAVPAPMTGAYLDQLEFGANTAFVYASPLSKSQFANTATDVIFQIGTLGAAFTGTLWIDDIKIE